MTTPDLSAMRTEYARGGLDETDAGDDPLALFRRWLDDAIVSGMHEPNAMALATATVEAAPSVRIVLLKHLDDAGAVFYTGYGSRKGLELATNPRAAGVLLWHPLQRQVRLEGTVEKVSPEESDAYFASRPPGSRVSAAASPQSRPVADRAELQRRVEQVEAASGEDGPPRPESWGGYRITLESLEFWQGRPDRLHDRLRFVRVQDAWRRERLAP